MPLIGLLFTFGGWIKWLFQTLLGSEIGRLFLCAVVCFCIGWSQGYRHEKLAWKAAIANELQAAKQRDIAEAKAAQQDAEEKTKQLEQLDKSNRETIDEYKRFIAKQKANQSCTLDDSDLRVLNGLR